MPLSAHLWSAYRELSLLCRELIGVSHIVRQVPVQSPHLHVENLGLVDLDYSANQLRSVTCIVNVLLIGRC